jgi:hypothetical protein
MKHTAGPWISDGYERVRPASGAQDGTNDICYVCHRLATGESCEANCRLIAAAPDLLTACEQALIEFDGDTQGNLDQLRDAIAKAKGYA